MGEGGGGMKIMFFHWFLSISCCNGRPIFTQTLHFPLVFEYLLMQRPYYSH